MQDEAARLIPERVRALAAPLGLTWRRIGVRDQRRRWGSCSARGDLNFNFRLMQMSREVVDYVVIHELMHRRQLNHSRRFWALVAEQCPSYRQSVAWLRMYGPYLGL
jgi:predicted metal-dependent hydrolase